MSYVTVILPTHNRPALLQEAIDSVLAQTFHDWELLVVDDASNPMVPESQKDARIRVLRHEQSRGGAAAKNTGIDHANGEVLAFLDDDDCYMPKYLERAIDVLNRYPEIDVVFMGVHWFGSNGEWGQANYEQAMSRFLSMANGRQVDNGVHLFDKELLLALLKSVPMAFQRPVVRKSAISRIGKYRPDCLLWDCDWAIEAALNASAALLSEGLYCQRSDGQGYSSKRDRTIEHLQSGISIKDRLWQQSRLGHHSQYLDVFRCAAADSWFDLAWHYYQQGIPSKAISALLRSARRDIRLTHLKLLARLMIPTTKLKNGLTR